MLFGELCEIMENVPRDHVQCTSGQWYRVCLEADGEEGWVDAKMIAPIGGKDYREYKKGLKTAAVVAMPMVYAVSENNGQTIPLTAGTRLPKYQVTKDQGLPARFGRFEVLGVGFRIDPGMVIEKPLEMSEQSLQQTVRFFLNVPYLWGGKNAMGMDCSGFVQTIMGLFGKALPRNASAQTKCGRKVRSLDKSRAGDLVFFNHGEPDHTHVTHVGILIDPARVIHCSGRVKVEKIDETGIISIEGTDKEHPQGVYTHELVGIRRV